MLNKCRRICDGVQERRFAGVCLALAIRKGWNMAEIQSVTERVSKMRRPGTTFAYQEVMALVEGGKDILALSGVPPWGPPAELVTNALSGASGISSVASSMGLIGLREAIVRKLSRDNDIQVGVDNVLVTNGAKEAIQLALHCVGDPGSEIVIPVPSYPYEGNVVLAGLHPVYVNANLVGSSTGLDLDSIESAISRRTSAILLNNPVNPTGQVFTDDEVKSLAEMAVRHRVWLIMDESFEKLVFAPARHVSIASLEGMLERTITLHSFSKAHGMGPWRVGYMVGASGLIEEARKVHEWLVLSVNPISQLIAQAALDGPQDWVSDSLRRFDEARGVAVGALDRIPDIDFYRPDAGGNIFVDVSSIAKDSSALSSLLLSEYGLATLPGAIFGDPRGIRFAFGGPLDVLADALERFEHGIRAYADRLDSTNASIARPQPSSLRSPTDV